MSRKHSKMCVKIIYLLLLLIQIVLNSATSDCPNNCTCNYKKAQARCTPIEEVPNFKNKITIADLQNNAIFDLKRDDFRCNTNFVKLDLQNNSISSIDSDSFHDLEFLKTLNLSNNKLLTLPEKLFVNNNKLEKINFNNNKDLYVNAHDLPKDVKYIGLLNTSTRVNCDDLKNFRYLKTYEGEIYYTGTCNISFRFNGKIINHTNNNLTKTEKENTTDNVEENYVTTEFKETPTYNQPTETTFTEKPTTEFKETPTYNQPNETAFTDKPTTDFQPTSNTPKARTSSTTFWIYIICVTIIVIVIGVSSYCIYKHCNNDTSTNIETTTLQINSSFSSCAAMEENHLLEDGISTDEQKITKLN